MENKNILGDGLLILGVAVLCIAAYFYANPNTPEFMGRDGKWHSLGDWKLVKDEVNDSIPLTGWHVIEDSIPTIIPGPGVSIGVAEWHIADGRQHYTNDGCNEKIQRESDSVNTIRNEMIYNLERGRFCWGMKNADDNGWGDLRGYADTIYYELCEGCKWVNFCNVIPSNEGGAMKVDWAKAN